MPALVLLTVRLYRLRCRRLGYLITAQFADDPHVQARKMLEYMNLGTDGLDRVPVCGIPVGLGTTPGEVFEPAFRVGQHNEDYDCGRLGFREERIMSLISAGNI